MWCCPILPLLTICALDSFVHNLRPLYHTCEEVLFTEALLSPVLKVDGQTLPDLWKLSLLVLVHCSPISRSYEVHWYLVGQLITHMPTPLEWSMIAIVATARICLPVS